ncbi:MAG: SIR2 family protein [Thermocladium sp.]
MSGSGVDLFGKFKSSPEKFMFFLGAGFSSGIGLPSGRELAESLAKRYKEEVQGLDDVISSLLKKGVNREEICEAIKEEFNKKKSIVKESSLLGLFHTVIGYVVEELDRRNSSGRVSIATTNWDETLTSFLGEKVEVIYPGKVSGTTGKRVTVYHLHGSINDCGSMILTREEKEAVRGDGENGPFQNLTDKFNVLMDRLKADVNERRVIFIGYSMADDDILSIYINSRKRVASSGEDYIIVKGEESKERIEGILADKGLKEAAKVVVMDSLEFLQELARVMGLVLDDRKVELETERSMRKMLNKKGSLIVVGPPLSGLTTLYNNHFEEFPPDKLSLDYAYDDGEKRAFNDLMERLLGGGRIALVGPEYTFNYYLNESGIGEKERKQIEEITVRHKVKEEEAKKYLEGLIERSNYSDKFDEKLKKKILALVKLGDDYPLKLLREVFRDVQVRIARGDKVEDIRRDLDEKKNRRREVEGILGVSLLVPPVLRDSAELASLLPQVSPYLAVALLAGGGLYEFIKYLKGEGDRPFNKIIGLKKYWDSLNESERRMLCYKLDEKNRLKPGYSEKYLKMVFGDELYDLERKIRELEEYLRSDLKGFQKRIEELERKYGDELNKLPELRDQVKSLSDELRNLIEEHERLKSKFESWSVGAPLFFIEDVEKGLLYSNFLVQVGVPKIKTSTPKGTTIEGLVESGRFHDVARDVLSKLRSEGRVALVGPRGVGKSTLATYAAWRTLLGGLDDIDTYVNALIRVDKLEPGAASRIENVLNGAAGKRFLLIYDPSSIEAYLEPETMQRGPSLKEIETTLKELKKLMGVQGAWVMVVLPSELYEPVERDSERDEELRRALEGAEGSKVDVDLRDEEFLSEIVKRYSGCGDVSEHLVERIMEFDSYTLIAKYVGVWLRESKCQVKDVDEDLRESAGEPKLFFAHYIWSTVLKGNEDLAKRVSVPLILHAAFGPIPEGVTYITKAVNEGGVWRLIDRDHLAKSKLEGLREVDLEPIAKWLPTQHEDLVEETLEELVGLRGEEARRHYIEHGFRDLIEALDWGYEKALEEVVESNLLVFIGERLKYALEAYANYWKRAAFIIGYGLAGHGSVPRPEDLPGDVIESLGDALRGCGIDDYLLIGNEIPPLIQHLTYTRVLTKAFIDKYGEAVDEVNRILSIARGRGSIYDSEEFYGLGLASIIANAAGAVEPGDADAALHIASFAIQRVASSNLIRPALGALKPLRDKAPHRYLELLALASSIENLDSDTVRYVFNELNDILSNYGDVVKGYAPSLVHAISAYAKLLWMHRKYFDDKEVEGVVDKIVGLLNELGRISPSLGVIAWTRALAPALDDEDVRGLMERALGIDVFNKTNEVLGELSKMRDEVQKLMRDEAFMSYVESWSIKADEEAVKRVILDAASFLKYELARYRRDNDELKEAEGLFNEAAKEDREIGDYEDYLISRGLALRAEVIEGSLVGGKLVDEFRQLYEETFEEHFEPTASYLSNASSTLGEYLVSLALTGDENTINKLLKEHWRVLNADEQASVLTRLMLNALLGPRGELSGELKGRLVVEPGELIEAFKYEIFSVFLPALMVTFGLFLPALMVTFGLLEPEDVGEACEFFFDEKPEKSICTDAVSAAGGNGATVEVLREEVLIKTFRERISKGEKLNLLKGLGFDAKSLSDEFRGLAYGLDGKSLVQLIAPRTSMALLALMLYALINGDEKLAKAHALYGTAALSGKLLPRLYLDVYRACGKGCDLGNEDLRQAITKLFLYHI